MANKMIINWDKGRIWHSDCECHFSGIMTPTKQEEERGLMECLHCGMKGWYPKGGSGRIEVRAVE